MCVCCLLSADENVINQDGRSYMKKNHLFIIILFLLLCGASLYAQISTDPQNDFYTYAESWELKGYVDHLPQLRPYPLAVIKSILSQVIEHGRDRDVEIAQEYYEQVTGKPFTLVLEGNYTKKRESNRDTNERSYTNQYSGGPFAVGDIQLGDLVSVGYSLGLYSTNVSDSEVLPIYTNSLYDTVSDPMSIGPFDVNIDMNTNVAVGTDKVYVQAGINRSGYGPFLGTDLALSDTSFHSPNLTLAYDGGRWSYTQLISSIGASLNNGSDLDSESEVDKYFAFHSIRFDVTKTLTVSYYESTIFGNRFDIAYMVPAPYMAVQGMGDSTDNSQMGLLIEYSPITCLKWSTNFLADDLDLDKMVKLHFDTKIRVGIQSGIQYSPADSACDLLGLDYTIITPYTYAHWSYDDDGKTFTDTTYNFLNYTNHGVSIGASLPPNSDRINFKARFSPVKRLTATISTSFIRHANAYESLSDSEAEKVYLTNYYSHKNGYVYIDYDDGSVSESAASGYTYIETDGGDIYSTDGSVFSQQKFIGDDNHVSTAWDYLNLLNQDHVMLIYQMGLDLAYQMPRMKLGQWTLKFGYVWEYIHNDGVQDAMYSGSTGDGDYTKAYEKWVDNLHETVNNYISFSVRIAY
jgi:hypothetical protein